MKNFSNNKTDTSGTLNLLKGYLNECEAVIIGAGAGLSTAAGHTYSGERFKEHFSDFESKYGFHDMYTGGFYPFETSDEFWAYWSRAIYLNRYACEPGKPYNDLKKIVADKEYFVLTTNVDHLFQKSGFDKERLFYTQGDYGLFQCSFPCHDSTYDNEEAVREMVLRQSDMRIPTELIPRCPECGHLTVSVIYRVLRQSGGRGVNPVVRQVRPDGGCSDAEYLRNLPVVQPLPVHAPHLPHHISVYLAHLTTWPFRCMSRGGSRTLPWTCRTGIGPLPAYQTGTWSRRGY